MCYFFVLSVPADLRQYWMASRRDGHLLGGFIQWLGRVGLGQRVQLIVGSVGLRIIDLGIHVHVCPTRALYPSLLLKSNLVHFSLKI